LIGLETPADGRPDPIGFALATVVGGVGDKFVNVRIKAEREAAGVLLVHGFSGIIYRFGDFGTRSQVDNESFNP